MTSLSRTVAIVGAGPGGLACAMLLAANGYQVDLYEKQPVVGGRTSQLKLGDYRFDRGATFFMMPQLLEEIFQAVGRQLKDYVDVAPVNPLYTLQYSDLQFQPGASHAETMKAIEQAFPGESAGYERFMQDERIKFDRIMPLLQTDFSSWTQLLSPYVAKAIPYLNATESVYQRLSRYFKDDRLKLAFTFQAKYLGMSPWECPGTFTMLSYLEHEFGLHHPIGGVNQLCSAMARVIQEYDGRIFTQTPVHRVLTKGGTAVGIQLEDGEKVSYDHVVLNADFGTAMTKLFEPEQLHKYSARKLAAKKYSCSTAMLYLGVKRKLDLPHHLVRFPANYRTNVEDIFRRGVLSKDPSLYVHNPSALDPTLAPEGHSSLYVLMPTANCTAAIDWRGQRDLLREQMYTILEDQLGLSGLEGDVEEELLWLPDDWRDQLDVYEGATFNLAHNLQQMTYFRPRNRFEEIDNVWLVGGGTHPGSGLPTIFESGRITARLMMKEDGFHQSQWEQLLPPSLVKGGSR